MTPPSTATATGRTSVGDGSAGTTFGGSGGLGLGRSAATARPPPAASRARNFSSASALRFSSSSARVFRSSRSFSSAVCFLAGFGIQFLSAYCHRKNMDPARNMKTTTLGTFLRMSGNR